MLLTTIKGCSKRYMTKEKTELNLCVRSCFAVADAFIYIMMSNSFAIELNNSLRRYYSWSYDMSSIGSNSSYLKTKSAPCT